MSNGAWIWLSLLLGGCPQRFMPLMALYGDARNMLAARKSPEFVSMLSAAERARNTDALPIQAQLTEQQCDREGITVIPWPDDRYPELLRSALPPPVAIYLTGNTGALLGPCISGVGSRRMSQYGRESVAAICKPLAACGAALVSGLAQGIDAEVHRAALAVDGITVAVLGTAINETFPRAHTDLRREIERRGAVISEFPPGESEYFSATFPQRNRIIAGLSRGVMIFEAAAKSGTMITARWALEYGREVMCVPGSILSSQSEGCNLLIKQGAAPITSASDVLEVLGLPGTAEKPKVSDKTPPVLFGLQKAVYSALESGAKTQDELIASTGHPPASVRAALSELEIDGLAEDRGGQFFIKI